MGLAGIHRHLDPEVVAAAPDFGDLAPPVAAGSVLESLLNVGGQAVPAVGVHRHLEGRRAEARIVMPLDEIVDLVLEFQRRNDLPRQEGRVDDLFRQRGGHLRHRHGERLGAERFDHPGAGACRDAHLEARDVGGGPDFLVHRHDRLTGVHVEPHDLKALVLLPQMVLEHVVHGEVGRLDVVDINARKLKHLGAREKAGRVAIDRPDNIDNAVAGLLDQLRRATAERHGGVDLDLHPAAGIFLDLLRPGLQHLSVRRGFRRQKVVEFEGKLLSHRGGTRQRQSRRSGERLENAKAHCFLPFCFEDALLVCGAPYPSPAKPQSFRPSCDTR